MRLLALLVTLALTACTLSVPQGAGKPAGVTAANPITGGPISVTTLENPAPAVAAPLPDAAAKPTPRPRPKSTDTPRQPGAVAADDAAEPPAPDTPAAPPRVVSAAEKTCVAQGGKWGPAGNSGGETCIKLTKDSGKQCDRESDCEGLCLARSMTCAPFNPMFGCNDILQDNGARVTLCID